MRTLALVLSFLAAPLSAHELWLEPLNYQIASDGNLEGQIVNGEAFEGTRLPYLPARFRHFIAFHDGNGSSVGGRPGDTPALNMSAMGDGLHVVVYQSTPSTLNYANWEKFQKFADHKDFDNAGAQHLERGLPLDDFDEVYIRFSKTLIAAGDGAGADLQTGLETELVALTNPYTDDLADGFRVQLFYQGAPRANEQVEMFEKAADGTVTITLHRTDDAGIATLPVTAGYAYMVDAVVLRVPSDAVAEDTGAVWETLWANLTFAVPDA
ncbi:DUF4198 domain-containing protein [Yoonia sp. 208BN28-4]|uniref:DUF4198 domain-containing protein n=1 Tax=Yoonia sp. 208BN28-4 TaxID=3126505 RepID=UPI0030A9B8EB